MSSYIFEFGGNLSSKSKFVHNLVFVAMAAIGNTYHNNKQNFFSGIAQITFIFFSF